MYMATNREQALAAIEKLIMNSEGGLSFSDITVELIADKVVTQALSGIGFPPDSDEYRAAYEQNYNYLLNEPAFQLRVSRYKMGMNYINASLIAMTLLVEEILKYKITTTSNGTTTGGGTDGTGQPTYDTEMTTNPDIKQAMITLESMSDKTVDLIALSMELGLEVHSLLLSAPEKIQTFRTQLKEVKILS